MQVKLIVNKMSRQVYKKNITATTFLICATIFSACYLYYYRNHLNHKLPVLRVAFPRGVTVFHHGAVSVRVQ